MNRRGRGFGLVGMRERIALEGGSLAIVSSPGTGTELRGRIPKRRDHSTVEHPALERVAHELRALRHAQLLLDVRAMRLDRANADHELLGDLGVGVAERDQPQDLELANAEVVRWAGRLGREPRAQVRLEIGLRRRRRSRTALTSSASAASLRM